MYKHTQSTASVGWVVPRHLCVYEHMRNHLKNLHYHAMGACNWEKPEKLRSVKSATMEEVGGGDINYDDAPDLKDSQIAWPTACCLSTSYLFHHNNSFSQ